MQLPKVSVEIALIRKAHGTPLYQACIEVFQEMEVQFKEAMVKSRDTENMIRIQGQCLALEELKRVFLGEPSRKGDE